MQGAWRSGSSLAVLLCCSPAETVQFTTSGVHRTPSASRVCVCYLQGLRGAAAVCGGRVEVWSLVAMKVEVGAGEEEGG